MNRLVRSRMPGGVGGARSKPAPIPISGECNWLQPAQAPGRAGLRSIFTHPGHRQADKSVISTHSSETNPQQLAVFDKLITTHLNKSDIET